MKYWCTAWAALALAACRPAGSTGLAEARADEPPAGRAARGTGFAVVELFTSEGCSSCPPADALLADLDKTPLVFAVEFHVDYWDDLGWPDRFASPEYTARQQAYANAFAARGLFTPQMIVNGVEQFTGSDRTKAQKSIAHALDRGPSIALSLEIGKNGSDTVFVDANASNSPADAIFDVAVVEHSVSSDVRAGENSGRRLRHTNVARAFATAALQNGKASVQVRIPPSLVRRDGEIIAYIQAPSGSAGMPILGAARAALPMR